MLSFIIAYHAIKSKYGILELIIVELFKGEAKWTTKQNACLRELRIKG